MVKVGDRVVVNCGYNPPVKVDSIVHEDKDGVPTVDPKKIACTRLNLDWGELGKSRVYLHDEGKTWYKCNDVN